MPRRAALRGPTIYRNWNGHRAARVRGIHRPVDEAAIQALVRQAVAEGRRLKPIGAGHSFNTIGMNRDLLVDLGGLSRVLAIDPARRQVTTQGGVSLAALIRAMAPHGLALANIGAWTEQTAAGVISTATHGTCGKHRETLIGSVARVRLVDGRGEIRELARGPGGFDLVTLGLFGVITEVTFDCVPDFSVAHHRRRVQLTEAAEALPGLLEAHDFVDLRWMGCNPDGLISTWDRVAGPPSRRDRWATNGIAAALNVLLRGVDFVSEARLPRWLEDPLTRGLARTYSQGAYRRPLVKPWHRALTFDSFGFAPRHDEHEYAIPREATGEAVRGLHRLLIADETSAGIEVQVRFSPAVDVLLAPNQGRETTWVDINVFNLDRTRALVERLVALLVGLDARPHWSKTFPTDSPWWITRYAAADVRTWLDRRRDFDPHGVFENAWYDDVWAPLDRDRRPADEG